MKNARHARCERYWSVAKAVDPADADRLRAVCDVIPSDVRTALDVGAGQGWLCDVLKSRRPAIEMTGTDWSENASKHFPGRFVVARSDQLPFPDRTFDLVTCCDCLEHLPAGVYEATLEELKRVSARYIIINTPLHEQAWRDRSTCRCPRCNRLFHCDHHVRFFSRNDYGALLAPEFKLARTETGGWDIRFLVRVPLSMAGLIQWGWRPRLVCPHCGNEKFDNPAWQRVVRRGLTLFDYAITRPFRSYMTRKSEIIGLFERAS